MQEGASPEPVQQTPYEKWQSRTFHDYTIDQNALVFVQMPVN